MVMEIEHINCTSQAHGPTTTTKNKKRRAPSPTTGDLYAQLHTAGLRVLEIEGDGNCLFRSIADQLHGDDTQHADLRQQAVAYMRNNPDDFAPFVEDDEPFEAYCKRMCEVRD